MSQRKIIAKNVSYLTISEILSRLLSLILILAISRFLGKVGLGIYTFAFAFVGIFAILSDFGISILTIRDVAKNKDHTKKYFRNYLAIKVLLSFVTFVVPSLIIFVTNESLRIKLIVLVVSLIGSINYLTFPFRAIFNAYESFKYVSYYDIFERVMSVALGILILYNNGSVLELSLILLLSSILSLCYIIFICSKNFIKIGLEFDFKFWGFLFKNSAPFWFVYLYTTIFYRTDILMLRYMKDFVEVGVYSAAYRLLEALTTLPTIITRAVFPSMSKFHVNNKLNLELIYKKSFYYLFLLTLPIAAGITIIAERVILLMYKEQFFESILVLKILSWTLIFISLNNLMGFLLISIEKQRLFASSTAFSGLINIALNAILIPFYSFYGASIATLIAQTINFAILYYFALKSGYKITQFGFIFKPILASTIMAAVLIGINEYNLFIVVPFCALLYFFSLFLLKGFGKEEIDAIKDLFSK